MTIHSTPRTPTTRNTTPPHPTPQASRATRFFHFPATWLVIGAIAVGAVSIFVAAGPIPAVMASAAAIAVYWVVMRFVAGRRTPELNTRRLLTDILVGAGIAIALLSVSVAVITLAGGYSFSFDGAAGFSALPALIAIAIGASVTEELLFRGLALQALERLTGSWVALVVTSLAFGAIHALNPAATLWTSIAISIEAGALMGAAFLWRRSLWTVIALHATWNGLEQALGIPVSGHTDPGVLVATIDGPAWLTGGAFGLEASIVPVILSLVFTAVLLVTARRRGTLVAAPWRKTKASALAVS